MVAHERGGTVPERRSVVAPASVGVKRTASQLAALGPDGLLLTPPAASADGLVKPAAPVLRTRSATCTPQTRGLETDTLTTSSHQAENHVAERPGHHAQVAYGRRRCIAPKRSGVEFP
jgi:hypothetical protein